jgi:hypothetical protein
MTPPLFRARRAAGLVLLAGWLAAAWPAAAGVGFFLRVELEPGMSVPDFARYDHVAVRVLRETASGQAGWHNRKERRDTARQAARAFPLRIIAALRTTQAYRGVTDAVARRVPTLVVDGVLRTLEEPGDEPRLFLRTGGSTPAAFEATLELRDSSDGRRLGRIIVDRGFGGVAGTGGGSRSLQQLMEAVAAACADELAKLRVPAPARTFGALPAPAGEAAAPPAPDRGTPAEPAAPDRRPAPAVGNG